MSTHEAPRPRGGVAQPSSRRARHTGDLYPLLLEPLLVARIWGADRLPRLHGMDSGAEPSSAQPDAPSSSGETSTTRRTPIGESWLLCDDNLVRNGSFAGRRVVEVVAALGEDLLGSANLAAYGSKLALLAKFLDAAADLSIQVHPDDSYALTHEAASGHLGKAEAWYVLDAAPGATVVWGFDKDMDAAEVRRAVAAGTLTASLNRVPVAPGDVIVNPAGTVHAVGAGLRLFEIQQASDLTYRLYDYDRRDAAGDRRELHLDKSLAVADLGRAVPSGWLGSAIAAERAGRPTRLEAGWRLLVDTPQFTLESTLVGADAPAVAARAAPEAAVNPAHRDTSTTPASFDLLVAVTGNVSVEPLPRDGGAALEPVTLGVGDAVLLPAALGPYRLTGSAEVLRSRVSAPPGTLRTAN